MIRVKNEIFARMEQMSPSERKVARTLLADYPSIGLASANTLAKAAGISAPTVLRLVSRLGMDSYADFQKHLRDEIMHELKAPVHRAEQAVDHDGDTVAGEVYANWTTPFSIQSIAKVFTLALVLAGP